MDTGSHAILQVSEQEHAEVGQPTPGSPGMGSWLSPGSWRWEAVVSTVSAGLRALPHVLTH